MRCLANGLTAWCTQKPITMAPVFEKRKLSFGKETEVGSNLSLWFGIWGNQRGSESKGKDLGTLAWQGLIGGLQIWAFTVKYVEADFSLGSSWPIESSLLKEFWHSGSGQISIFLVPKAEGKNYEFWVLLEVKTFSVAHAQPIWLAVLGSVIAKR